MKAGARAAGEAGASRAQQVPGSGRQAGRPRCAQLGAHRGGQPQAQAAAAPHAQLLPRSKCCRISTAAQAPTWGGGAVPCTAAAEASSGSGARASE